MVRRAEAPRGLGLQRSAARLRRRDAGELDRVYREHAGTVLGYLVGTLRDRGTAEDVHQQVFLEVWQRAPDYDPSRAGVLTWILTIARSRAIDELRRRVPEPREPEEAARLADDDGGDMADRLAEQWQMAHLLGRLRPEESMVLRLRFYSGLSQTEIAERSGLPLGTVKMRMVAALRRLRVLLEAEEPDAPPAPSLEAAGLASHPERVKT